MGLGATLTTTLLATMAVMSLLWLLGTRLRDVSIVDLYWGPGFAVITWLVFGLAPPQPNWPGLLLPVLVTLWALRLGLYLAWRNHGRGEDPRYAAMRAAAGGDEPFRRVSLTKVFLLQGGLMWLISLPLQIATYTGLPKIHWLGTAGLILWLVGFYFEAVGDWQLARFRADPANRGRVMDRGLWRYTRHPNYFGDACVWWGFYLLAAEVGAARWTIFAPVLMTFLLLRVTGKALLERGLGDSKPGYAEYVRRTSGFFPLPRRR